MSSFGISTQSVFSACLVDDFNVFKVFTILMLILSYKSTATRLVGSVVQLVTWKPSTTAKCYSNLLEGESLSCQTCLTNGEDSSFFV